VCSCARPSPGRKLREVVADPAASPQPSPVADDAPTSPQPSPVPEAASEAAQPSTPVACPATIATSVNAEFEGNRMVGGVSRQVIGGWVYVGNSAAPTDAANPTWPVANGATIEVTNTVGEPPLTATCRLDGAVPAGGNLFDNVAVLCRWEVYLPISGPASDASVWNTATATVTVDDAACPSVSASVTVWGADF